MSDFKDVTIVKQANVYYDGAVTSRTITFASGETKTLGIMQPGEYTFNTGKAEIMEMLSGDVDVLLAGESEWKHYQAGDSFKVPANSSFQIKVGSLADYCCSFLD